MTFHDRLRAGVLVEAGGCSRSRPNRSREPGERTACERHAGECVDPALRARFQSPGSMIRPPKAPHEPQSNSQARDIAHSSDCEMNAQRSEATGSPIFQRCCLNTTRCSMELAVPFCDGRVVQSPLNASSRRSSASSNRTRRGEVEAQPGCAAWPELLTGACENACPILDPCRDVTAGNPVPEKSTHAR